MSVEIGSYLRQAREAIGLSLEQLQEKTKIQKSFLIAIENGEFDKLPSPFYVRTYLRSYANCVKIEPHHILRQYRKMEQAERLTGVHKAVTQSDLQHTQGLPPLGKLQQTGKMPVINKNNPSQNTVRMKSLSAQHTSPQRINTQTALTASKNNLNRANERAQARRNLGYQRTTGINKKDMPSGVNPAGHLNNSKVKKELYPTVAPKTRQTGYQQASAQTGPQVKAGYQQASAQTGPQVKAGYQQASAQTGPQAKAGYQQTSAQTGPQAKAGYQQASAQTGPQVKAGYQQGQTTSPNDRLITNNGPVSRTSGSFKKMDLNNAPLPSVSPGELEKSSGGTRHRRLSRVERLGRKASRSRRGAKKSFSRFSFKSPVAMAVAGLILCIPLGWAIMSYTGYDFQPDSNADQQNEKSEVPVIPPDKKGTLQLAQQDVNIVHYRLSGTDQIVVMIHAAGGKSRVELRTSLPSEGGSPIEDVTLPQDQKWSYQYTYDGNSDFYIGLSAPEDSIVYINGQVVKSARYVHVRKMD